VLDSQLSPSLLPNANGGAFSSSVMPLDSRSSRLGANTATAGKSRAPERRLEKRTAANLDVAPAILQRRLDSTPIAARIILQLGLDGHDLIQPIGVTCERGRCVMQICKDTTAFSLHTRFQGSTSRLVAFPCVSAIRVIAPPFLRSCSTV